MHIIAKILLWTTYIISLYFTIFWVLVFIEKRASLKNEEKQSYRLTKFPLVSIIIPAYNEESNIKQTILSVLELDYPKDKREIIVVNDGSTDNTLNVIKQLKKLYPCLNIIDQKNQGKAASLNNALKIAKGEFFACLDADSIVEASTLKRMLAFYYHQDDKDLAIITPAMKVNKPKKLVHQFQRLEYLVALFIARLMSHLDCLYVAPGPFSLYRKDKIIELGGFDQDNLTEDMEIAYRVQSRNLTIKQCYNAYVYTNPPSTFKGLYTQRNRWFKGGLINALKYKKIILNQNYGDFGMIQMSINLLTFFLSLSAILFFGYYMLWPLARNIYNFSLVNFDIIPYLNDLFKFNFNILNIDLGKTFIIYFLLVVTGTIIYVAHSNANEKITKRRILYLIPYFLVYYLVLSLVSVVVMIQLMLGKRQKW